jgi:two-component system, sensor histidine kinase and response regulator
MRSDTILAVDDDPLNRAILEELLGDTCHLVLVESGEEALRVAPALRPDLVLLDIMMPGMDGYETCRQMRGRKELAFTKIVLVSARAMLAERLRDYSSGADDYVVKPFDHEELKAKIRVFLRLKRAEEIESLKSEFLVLMAHETRAPMEKLLLAAQVLNEEVAIPHASRKHLARLARETAGQLSQLFELGMQYSTLRAGRGTLLRSVFDVGAVLAQVVAELTPAAEARGAVVEFARTGTPRLESDQENLERIARLLVESALDRLGGAGSVRILLEETEAGLALRVRARDPEALPENLPRLFDPSPSADLSHYPGGSVLKLPLAAELTRHLQGTLLASLRPDQEVELCAVFPWELDLPQSDGDELPAAA